MPITLDGGAGVTFPDAVQQTNALTNTGGTPRYYAARAWVNFDGNSGAIRAQANITSVSRTGTGQYTITIDTDMPDANYVIIATPGPAEAHSITTRVSILLRPQEVLPSLYSVNLLVFLLIWTPIMFMW